MTADKELPERLRKDSELMAYYAPRCPKGENEMHAWMVRTSKDLTAAIQRIEATAPLSATGATSDPFSMGPYVGDRSVKFLRQTFDAAADACDGDYPAKVNAGMLACYDSGRREGALLAAPTAPVVEEGAIPEEVVKQQEALMHPATQVFFRAGLLACREYMARFVEPQDAGIAASIRANWWPSLGQDFGPPRLNDWSEFTEGEYGTDSFRCKTADEVSPTQEALPIAAQFLEACRSSSMKPSEGAE